MQIGTKEHHEILENFEKHYSHLRLDKEKSKGLWRKGQVYENGETNALYQAYIIGYGFGRLNYLT